MDAYDVHEGRSIIVPENELHLNSTIYDCIMKPGVSTIGLDCEWEDNGPVALIQIATEDHVILFQVCKFAIKGLLPDLLAYMLWSEHLIKVGVNIEEDAKRIQRTFRLPVRGWIDLRCYAIRSQLLGEYLLQQLKDFEFHHCRNDTSSASMRKKRSNFMPKLGLDALAATCLGKSLIKNSSTQIYGRWNALYLSDDEIAYAAADAASSLDIFLKLCDQNGEQKNVDRYAEVSYDHIAMRMACLDLICSVSSSEVRFLLHQYYGSIARPFGIKSEITSESASTLYQYVDETDDDDKINKIKAVQEKGERDEIKWLTEKVRKIFGHGLISYILLAVIFLLCAVILCFAGLFIVFLAFELGKNAVQWMERHDYNGFFLKLPTLVQGFLNEKLCN